MINHTINTILQQRHSHSKIDTRLSLDTLYMHKNHSFIYLPDVTERCLKKNNSKLKKKKQNKKEKSCNYEKETMYNMISRRIRSRCAEWKFQESLPTHKYSN